MARNLHLETAERRNSISRKPIIDKTKIGKNRREIKNHRERSIHIERELYT